MDAKELSALAGIVAKHGEEFAYMHGQIATLTAAVLALVRTHASPPAFAREMRRSWLQLGEPHTRFSTSPPALEGIDSMLHALEQSCPVPLNLRAPRAD